MSGTALPASAARSVRIKSDGPKDMDTKADSGEIVACAIAVYYRNHATTHMYLVPGHHITPGAMAVLEVLAAAKTVVENDSSMAFLNRMLRGEWKDYRTDGMATWTPVSRGNTIKAMCIQVEGLAQD